MKIQGFRCFTRKPKLVVAQNKAKVVEARAKNSNGRLMPKMVLENHSFAYS